MDKTVKEMKHMEMTEWKEPKEIQSPANVFSSFKDEQKFPPFIISINMKISKTCRICIAIRIYINCYVVLMYFIQQLQFNGMLTPDLIQ